MQTARWLIARVVPAPQQYYFFPNYKQLGFLSEGMAILPRNKSNEFVCFSYDVTILSDINGSSFLKYLLQC